MKKLISILSIGILLFAGCQTEELDTNQYSDTEVTLVSYGPNPVMRGATLSFYGSNLDKVNKVEVPGVPAITSIEVVKRGNPSEIRVQLPADGTTVGVITLTASDGTVLKTQAELTYTEPIVFTSFSATEAMPGDVITITGDYMNLVTAVIFADDVTVPVNDGATRYQTSVTVPPQAITGEPQLTDGENLIYTFTTISIGDPTVSGLKVETPKPGNEIVISGKYLGMIESITFEGGVKVDASNFEVSEDGTTITVAIPADAKSGDVVLTDYAGDSFTAGSITMTNPSGLKVSPTPVKAGEPLEISGKDLDVVTTVNFSGANGAEFSYADGKITVTAVPATAKEGDITLVMANGESSTVAFTLVHPTVTSVAPTTIMAGETIEVSGTDLDLITGVTLGGKEEEFTATNDAVTITTSATSVAGKIVLKLANGETVEPSEKITVNYDSFIVVNEMPSAEHIGATVTLKGSNFMMIDRIYIGDAKVTQYIKRTDEEISFIMPYNKVGTYSIVFELMNGDTETCPNQIEVLLEINHIIAWEGNTTITWNDGGRVMVPAAKFNGVSAGTVMRLYYTQKDQTWAQAQVNYGDWSGINFTDTRATTFNGTLVPTDIYGWFSDGILDRCTEVILTKDILANIQTKKGDCEGQTDLGIIIQGSDLTFTKVEILQEIPQEVTLFEGNVSLTWGDDGRFGLAMQYFENAQPGSKLIFYFEQTDAWGQVQLNDGWWGNADMYFPEIDGAYITTNNVGGKDVTRLELTLTEATLNHILATPGDYFGVNTAYKGDGRVAMVIQGSDWIITKVTIL